MTTDLLDRESCLNRVEKRVEDKVNRDEEIELRSYFQNSGKKGSVFEKSWCDEKNEKTGEKVGEPAEDAVPE